MPRGVLLLVGTGAQVSLRGGEARGPYLGRHQALLSGLLQAGGEENSRGECVVSHNFQLDFGAKKQTARLT